MGLGLAQTPLSPTAWAGLPSTWPQHVDTLLTAFLGSTAQTDVQHSVVRPHVTQSSPHAACSSSLCPRSLCAPQPPATGSSASHTACLLQGGPATAPSPGAAWEGWDSPYSISRAGSSVS